MVQSEASILPKIESLYPITRMVQARQIEWYGYVLRANTHKATTVTRKRWIDILLTCNARTLQATDRAVAESLDGSRFGSRCFSPSDTESAVEQAVICAE